MEKLLENLTALFADMDLNDIKIDKDEDENVIIYFTKKKRNTELQKIRKEIEDLDDEIFEEAAKKLKESNPTAFEVMKTLEDAEPNMDNIRVAYTIFKAIVKEVVEQKIREYTDEVNRLFNKYLNNEGE